MHRRSLIRTSPQNDTLRLAAGGRYTIGFCLHKPRDINLEETSFPRTHNDTSQPSCKYLLTRPAMRCSESSCVVELGRLPQASCYLLLSVVFDHPFTINPLLFWDNSIHLRLVVELFNQKAHYSEVLK